MTPRAWRPGPPLLALSAGWVALFAWGGMVTRPGRFLVPALFVGLVMTLVGIGLRFLGVRAYAVAAVQLVTALLFLNLLTASGRSLLGFVPTPGSVRSVVHLVYNGALTLNAYSAPVEVNPAQTQAMLLACSLAVLLSMEVLAMGLRRPTLAGLPLLVTLSVPVSILRDPLPLLVFVGTALLYLRLLASDQMTRLATWETSARGVGTRLTASRTSRAALRTLWNVSVAAVLVALLAAPLVPVSHLFHRDGGGGQGPGSGAGLELRTDNPILALRRDLVSQTHTPLVYADTQSRSTSYLRTTVLDEFTGGDWRPSPRNLPASNLANGAFPTAPGLSPGTGGVDDAWALELTPQYSTRWLPLPYPVHDVEVAGNWRYDARTLDVSFVNGEQPSQLGYRATAFTPSISPSQLNSAAPAPAALLRQMTRLPTGLPKVITTTAEDVTSGATSDFAKAVALQDWFRTGGGFRYSLNQRSGSGMDLLASFITNDRVGYCEQFAAAMAAMGRTLGIPSRVVVGFLDGHVQRDGRILYTSDDRHAWPEMYFTGAGWVRFEPTPAQRSGASPAWTRQDTATVHPSTAPSAAASRRPAPRAVQTPAATGVVHQQRTPVPWRPVAAFLVLLALLLLPALARLVQRRRRLSGRSPVHLAEGAWAELRATALDLGLDWPELRSPRQQARRVTEQVRAEPAARESLEGLLLRVERGRYGVTSGAAPLEAETRADTVATVEVWCRAMVGSVGRGRGWRRRVWPVSLVHRSR